MCWMGRKSSESFTSNAVFLVYLSSFAVTLVSGHHSENWLFLTVDGSVVEQMVNPDSNSCPRPSLLCLLCRELLHDAGSDMLACLQRIKGS